MCWKTCHWRVRLAAAECDPKSGHSNSAEILSEDLHNSLASGEAADVSCEKVKLSLYIQQSKRPRHLPS